MGLGISPGSSDGNSFFGQIKDQANSIEGISNPFGKNKGYGSVIGRGGQNTNLSFIPSTQDSIQSSLFGVQPESQTNFQDPSTTKQPGTGSVRGRTSKAGAQVIAPSKLGSSSIGSTFTTNNQDTATYGGNDVTYDYTYGNNSPQVLGQAGINATLVRGPGGTSYTQSPYSLGNQQAIFGDNTPKTSTNNPGSSSFGSVSSDIGALNANVSAPDSVSLNNTIQQTAGGRASVLSQDAASRGNVDTSSQNYSDLNQAGMFGIQALTNLIPGAGLAAGFFMGKPSTYSREKANTTLNADQNLGIGGGVRAPGSLDFSRQAGINAYGNTVIPNTKSGQGSASNINIEGIQNGNLTSNGGNAVGQLAQQGGASTRDYLDVVAKLSQGKGLLGLLSKPVSKDTTYLSSQNLNDQGLANLELQGNASGRLGQTQSLNASNRTFDNINNGSKTAIDQTLTSNQDVAGNVVGKDQQAQAIAGGETNASAMRVLSNNKNVNEGGTATQSANAKVLSSILNDKGSVDAVSKASEVLSGKYGATTQAQAQVQVQRFLDGLQALPQQTAEDKQIIATLQQNPELAWLFDGSNSPKTIVNAIASATSTQNLGAVNSDSGKSGVNGENVNLVGWNTFNPQIGEAKSQINIDPGVNAKATRYYNYDPTPDKPNSGDEKAFGNVFGQVQALTPGQLYDINYKDKFDASANSAIQNFASSNISAQGTVNGGQLYYAPGQDQMYNSLANYATGLRNNTNSQQDSAIQAYLSQINSTAGQNLTPQEKAIANNLMQQQQQVKQGNLSNLQAQLRGSQEVLQNTLNQINAYKGSASNFVQTPNGLVERNPGQLQSLTDSLNNQLNSYNQINNQVKGASTDVSYQDILPQFKSADTQSQLVNAINQDKQAKQTQVQQLTNNLKTYTSNLDTLTNRLNDEMAVLARKDAEFNSGKSQYTNPNDYILAQQASQQRIASLKAGVAQEQQNLNSNQDYVKAKQNIDSVNNEITQLNQYNPASRQYAESYDQYGNAMMNGRSVADYQALADKINAEQQFDAKYGTNTSNAGINFSNIAGGANASSYYNVQVPSLKQEQGYVAPSSATFDSVRGLTSTVGGNYNTNLGQGVKSTFGMTSNGMPADLRNYQNSTYYGPTSLTANGIGRRLDAYGVYLPYKFRGEPEWSPNKLAASSYLNSIIHG